MHQYQIYCSAFLLSSHYEVILPYLVYNISARISSFFMFLNETEKALEVTSLDNEG